MKNSCTTFRYAHYVAKEILTAPKAQMHPFAVERRCARPDSADRPNSERALAIDRERDTAWRTSASGSCKKYYCAIREHQKRRCKLHFVDTLTRRKKLKK